jgi:hypothetical protein
MYFEKFSILFDYKKLKKLFVNVMSSFIVFDIIHILGKNEIQLFNFRRHFENLNQARYEL